MKKYLSTLLLLTVIISCGSDDGDSNAHEPVNIVDANVNDLQVSIQKVTTPSAPNNPGNYDVFFAKAANTIIYANPSNTNIEQFMLGYSIDNNAYTSLLPHQEVCACGYGSKIVYNDGYLYYIANEAFKYSIEDNEWFELNYPDNIQENNGEAGVVPFNNKIYFLGGRDATTRFKYYDTTTNEWYNAADYPIAVGTPELVTAQNRIYAIGGDAQNKKFSYYSEAGGWTALPDLTFEAPFSRDNFTAATFQGRYIFVQTYQGMHIYDAENEE